ncbi:response regulator [Pedobacter insulae]|uniref:Response regulator receiver domain-containing protein n=1 Tax=Pedobacter insulae TaxID=414048 RepID=A0A1I2ZUX1_9SPHI|nr:response regulator [Pedobacter insulae]SFH41657.1 Response regulator receiver domain-containing protein [Pedobacter insulae]
MKFNFRGNSTKKKKILIVEDEPMSVLLIQQILKSYQFELIVATNGVDAIEKFKNTDISLVIMDLYMPEMDGFEASKRIKQISKDTPIIVISTTTIAEDDLKKDIGIDYFLAKPLNVVKFKDFIHMLLLA